MRVAFLGPKGTYSEAAAAQVGGESAEYLEVKTFREAIQLVEAGDADVAVIPVENALEGPVSASMDHLIHETDLHLCGEVAIPIKHVLVGMPGASLAVVREVVSHPQALGQCRAWLEREMPGAEQVAFMSTSGAVQDVVTSGDPTRVAIGPERSQALYGGEVLARDIQDAPQNMTRFFVLGRERTEPSGDDKTFLAFKIDKDMPGSLYTTLEPFARAGIQLTNVITRPTKGWLGEYYFLLDLVGHQDDPDVAAALEEVRNRVMELKIVGSCPRFPIETLVPTETA